MKYLFTILSFLIVPVCTSIAQQTSGFSNPDDIQQLLDYRLPDWGYSNFMLDFSSSGTLLNSLNKNLDEDLERKRQRINLLVTPGYELYRESEERIFELNSNIALDYRNRRDKFSGDNSIEKDRRYNSELDIATELREYISSNTFFLAGEELGLAYNSSSREEHVNESLTADREELSRLFSSDTQLGIGIGRVRNVSPMIRALRLKERYGVLANGNQLDNGEVTEAADVFTRYGGYQQRYDRPEKHFWQAMDEAAKGSFRNLEPFDMLYLTDVLDESIGQRLEGWELAAGGEFNYRNSLDRINIPFQDPSFERSLSIRKRVGLFIEGRWYKNISLNHQIGFVANASRNYPLDTDVQYKWNTFARAKVSWLWNITDRFLMNMELRNRYNDTRRKADEFFDSSRSWSNNSVLSSSFTYFIENRLALHVNARYTLNYNGESSQPEVFDRRISQLRFSAGVQYYFSRNLY